jgi:hypothetical protein
MLGINWSTGNATALPGYLGYTTSSSDFCRNHDRTCKYLVKDTPAKVEKKDSSVIISSFVPIVFCMETTTSVVDPLDVRHDMTGVVLESERLPKQNQLPRKNKYEY